MLQAADPVAVLEFKIISEQASEPIFLEWYGRMCDLIEEVLWISKRLAQFGGVLVRSLEIFCPTFPFWLSSHHNHPALLCPALSFVTRQVEGDPLSQSGVAASQMRRIRGSCNRTEIRLFRRSGVTSVSLTLSIKSIPLHVHLMIDGPEM